MTMVASHQGLGRRALARWRGGNVCTLLLGPHLVGRIEKKEYKTLFFSLCALHVACMHAAARQKRKALLEYQGFIQWRASSSSTYRYDFMVQSGTESQFNQAPVQVQHGISRCTCCYSTCFFFFLSFASFTYPFFFSSGQGDRDDCGHLVQPAGCMWPCHASCFSNQPVETFGWNHQ